MSNPFDLIKYQETYYTPDELTKAKFENIVPEFLMTEWKERGFSSYMDGLIITTNPDDFYDVIEGWVDDYKKCHVVMRTAFGAFYYLKDGNYYYRSVIHDISTELTDRLDFIIKFSINNKENQNDIFHKDIYDKAVKRLGKPAFDEVYAFVPAIAIGGDYNPDNLQKVKLREHLAFLQQLL